MAFLVVNTDLSVRITHVQTLALIDTNAYIAFTNSSLWTDAFESATDFIDAFFGFVTRIRIASTSTEEGSLLEVDFVKLMLNRASESKIPLMLN